MTSPEHHDKNSKEVLLLETMQLEQSIGQLFVEIMAAMSKKGKSFQLMKDNDFEHRKDRECNDIHLFFGLYDGSYFHLKAYTRHMLSIRDRPCDKIYLTGYRKSALQQHGGDHSLWQGWYDWDPKKIASEISSQNPDIF